MQVKDGTLDPLVEFLVNHKSTQNSRISSLFVAKKNHVTVPLSSEEEKERQVKIKNRESQAPLIED
jgi:hypothetical protein